MDEKISIISARYIKDKKWEENVKCIYELIPFDGKTNIPLFISTFINKTIQYLNKYKIFIGIRLFFNRSKFNVIISNSIEQAITFSFLTMIFGKRKIIHILNELYFQAPLSFRNKIRPWIFKCFINQINYIRVSSLNEIDNYSRILNLQKNKFWFLHYPTPVIYPRFSNEDEGYILSAGKQYRDYATLVKALNGTGLKTIIISDYKSMNKVKPCDEIFVYYNISKNKYLELLRKAKMVVIPLNNDFCSCGQIALLEAMSYGKSVITAKVTGTKDYIEDYNTGLFYEMGNPIDLKNKILKLYENDDLRYKLSNNAFDFVKTNFTYNIFAEKYLQFIEDKWNELSQS